MQETAARFSCAKEASGGFLMILQVAKRIANVRFTSEKELRI